MSFYIKIGKDVDDISMFPSVYLYYPGDPEYVLTDIELNLKVGDAGQLSFRIYKDHPYYDRIAFNREFVYVYRDGTAVSNIIFYGFISEINRDIENTLTVYCTGALGILDRTLQPPMSVGGSYTVATFLKRLITRHNDYLITDHIVDYGEERVLDTAVLGDYRDSPVYGGTSDYTTTLEAIRTILAEPFGLYPYIAFTHSWYASVGFFVYLAPIELYGDLSDQTIEFGENLLQYADQQSSDGIYTAILPLGKRKDNAEKDSVLPYEDYYTIWSVNDHALTLKNAAAAELYGFRCALVQWDWITSPSALKTKAQAWLNNLSFSNLRLTLTALDLSMLGADYSAFKLGDRVHCTATPVGLDITLPIYEMNIYPLEPDRNTITLGSDEPAITSGTASSISGGTSGGPEALDMLIKTYTCNYSVNSGQYAALSANGFDVSTPSGYTPIGIQRIAAGNGNMLIRAYNAKATGDSAVINLYNNSSSTVSATATIDIVYVR